MKKILISTALLSLSILNSSCTIDAYEKGEGDYSLMTAEFVEAYVGSDKTVAYVETDDGQRLALQAGFTTTWIQTADTTYRALLYYNKVRASEVEPVRMSRVGVLQCRDSVKGGLKTDPLYIESAWLSKNLKYLNLRLCLLTGSTDDEEAQHVIGLVRDTLASTPSHLRLQLYHDQGGCPEYYSFVTYASIPLADIAADTITLNINTYEGMMSRSFCPSQGH